MTKLEICSIEDVNPGQVNLFQEGSFYKAYQKSAWILCTRVHPFKVSARPLKGLDGLLLSVGFPTSSLEKFSAGLFVERNITEPGQPIILCFNEQIDGDVYNGSLSFAFKYGYFKNRFLRFKLLRPRYFL